MVVGPGTGQVQRDPSPPYDDEGRPTHQRSIALAVIVAVVAVVVGVVIWQNASAPKAVATVRYVNDTGVRVVVTPCGAKTRCVLEVGASTVGKPPGDVTPRVVDAATQRIRGCLPYPTGERIVHLSDADTGGGSC